MTDSRSEAFAGASMPEHPSAVQIRRLKKLALRQLRLIKKARAGKKLPKLGRPKKARKAHKAGSRSAKAKMAHVRSFKGKGHKKTTKKSGHRTHVSKAPGALVARYHSLKSAYHAAGLDLFKHRHHGLTPKQWSKKHRKAKHKGKGR
jgi:hypothetical protein